MIETYANRGVRSRPLLDVRHEERKVLQLKHYHKEGQIHKEQIAEKMQHNSTKAWIST